jgi:hypothetical protein
MMLRALYFTDSQFTELSKEKDPDRWSAATRSQLLVTNLANIREEVDGDRFEVSSEFCHFVADPNAVRFRSLCKKVLETSDEMRFFFEDIRDEARRLAMAEWFFRLLSQKANIADAIMENLASCNYAGIGHRRCWVADCAARYLGVSHNRMNVALRVLGVDVQKLGNPFNQLTYRSKRFMSAPETHQSYANGVKDAFSSILASGAANIANSEKDVANRLLALRLDGAIKLRKLDPLQLVIAAEAAQYGLSIETVTVRAQCQVWPTIPQQVNLPSHL